MLAGQPPFRGENLLSLADAIRSSTPKRLSGEASSLDSTIKRALSKDTAQRYQAVTELLGNLRTGTRPPGAPVTPLAAMTIPSIAVLSFADMSPEKDQDYFCEGMAEELINALTGLEGLHVSARTSSFKFKGQALDAPEIGSQLKVSSILEGSVRKAGNRLRITAQLINVDDGFHLWSERYDRTMDDVFEVQDEIARTVVEKLKVKLLGGADTPLVKQPTDNVEAYNLVLQGRYQPYRVCRRAFSLRGWSHVTTESVFPEVRERAVRLPRDGAEHPSEWAAIESIAGKLGCTAETLRKWVRQAERIPGSAVA